MTDKTHTQMIDVSDLLALVYAHKLPPVQKEDLSNFLKSYMVLEFTENDKNAYILGYNYKDTHSDYKVNKHTNSRFYLLHTSPLDTPSGYREILPQILADKLNLKLEITDLESNYFNLGLSNNKESTFAQLTEVSYSNYSYYRLTADPYEVKRAYQRLMQ